MNNITNSNNINELAFVCVHIGNYESKVEEPIDQTIICDYILFTDDLSIKYRKWKLYDANKYKYGIDDNIDMNKDYCNSLSNNNSMYNTYKFIKMNLHKLDELKQYKYIIWIDANKRIINENNALICKELLEKGGNFITFEVGSIEQQWAYERGMIGEINESLMRSVYMDQDIINHALTMIEDGFYFTNTNIDLSLLYKKYKETQDVKYLELIKNANKHKTFYKDNKKYLKIKWTGMIAIDMINSSTKDILELWWYHNMKYSTVEQISLPYILWKLDLEPCFFEDYNYKVNNTMNNNDFFKVIVRNHN